MQKIRLEREKDFITIVEVGDTTFAFFKERLVVAQRSNLTIKLDIGDDNHYVEHLLPGYKEGMMDSKKFIKVLNAIGYTTV